jgi:hypothetical protein
VILKSELVDGDKSIKLRAITTGITKIEIITNALFIVLNLMFDIFFTKLQHNLEYSKFILKYWYL